MSIPKEVLAVERPKNTIVIAYGKNKDKYAVRERVGCKYDKGRRVPINGKIIGHIVDFKFVKKQENKASQTKTINPNIDNLDIEVCVKDWGNVALCDSLFQSMLDELTKIYSLPEALKIYCIAILRVCYPGIKDTELKDRYQESFLSELYPGVALSEKTTFEFLTNLGKAYGKIVMFMRNRISSISLDDKLIIDGVLKTNNSAINSLLEFSRKSKKTENKNVSILYAFSLQKHEPICSKCYFENMLDITFYDDFVTENQIKQGVIVSDKGFSASFIEEHLVNNLDLHYLNPLKRNSRFVNMYKLLDFKTTLDTNKEILCKKAKDLKTGKILYSFKDLYKKSREEIAWISKQKGDFSNEEYEGMKKKFGVIVFESDLDMSSDEIYQIYKQRWEIELVMKYYKSTCELLDTRAVKHYTAIGSEYGDFLATILTYRLINYFDKKGLLEKNTYQELMSTLSKAKKVKLSSNSKEWKLAQITASHKDIIEELLIAQ